MANSTQTPRMAALQNLSNSLPVANSRVAKGQQAARDMQLQQAVAAAPANQNTTQAAQTTAAAATQNAGQQMIENATGQIKEQSQLGTVGLQEQQDLFQQGQATTRLAGRQESLDSTERLAKLDSAAKQELFDKQMKFEKDEAGRTLWNEEQLQDYARQNARSDDQLKNYQLTVEQATKRKLQTMEQAYNLIQLDLDNQLASAEQKKDQTAKQQIIQAKREADAAMQREKERRANNAAAWQQGGATVGGIVGGVVGAVYGGPAGAAAGYSAGSALGGAAGSVASQQTTKKPETNQ